MLLGKKRKLGRQIEEMSVGEKLTLTEKIEDKDILLYLGLTNDANPLFIQHDFASQTTFKKPVVPTIMLTGIVASAISKYLPGPGSYIKSQSLSFPLPVYHYSVVHFLFEVKEIDIKANEAVIEVIGKNEEEKEVVQGVLTVCPPKQIDTMNGRALENF
ncbi:MaoC/PaaZ C-terminal domain-containing protein [Bacillus kexueae]|uniref:MaoC/PaaZ C-terminal domain-containing protein n=1 Tax=Aeribacillus kexueae TaxID=2078952 RepID=UPI001FAEEF67|nr:MaoC/PaaZ C-terminal domain-containing protein [Bacillus kexueae]